MKVAFRVDSSFLIGSGHVMRCLTLADELRSQGIDTFFICREQKGHLGELIMDRGYPLFVLSQPQTTSETGWTENRGQYQTWIDVSDTIDAQQTLEVLKKKRTCDWMVVDHYALTSAWHRRIKSFGSKIMVIDDLADRQYDCDLLLDQTFFRNKTDYQGLISEKAQLLLGTEYALLRPDFYSLREKALTKRSSFEGVKHVLISMGGVNTLDITKNILAGLETIPNIKYIVFDVVMGRKGEAYEEMKKYASSSSLNINVFAYVKNMADSMLQADLAIGTAGSSSWERCCLGLPALLISVADNQSFLVENLAKSGAIIQIQGKNEILSKNIAKAFETIIGDVKRIKKMSQVAFEMCDGMGTKRTVDAMTSSSGLFIRKANVKDTQLIYEWQSAPSTRKYCRNPQIPSLSEYKKWMKDVISDLNRELMVLTASEGPVGLVRMDKLDSGVADYEISILISPEQYQKGYGKKALSLARDEWPDYRLFAEIHKENIASIKLFQSSGYKQLTETLFVNEPKNVHN